MFANMPTAIQHVRDGRLRALALNSPDLKDRLTSQGADPIHQTPEQYTTFVQSESAKWAQVIQAAGIKGE